MRKMTILLVVMVVVLGVFAAATQATGAVNNATAFQDASKAAARVSGTIARSNPGKSNLIIKEHNSNIERTVVYNESTKWTKEGKTADQKEFKDGSRVVCIGTKNDKGELVATRIELQK